MRKQILLTVALLLAANSGFSQETDTSIADTALGDTTQTSDIKQALIEQEKAVYEAIKNGEMELFASFLAENFISVNPEGITDREQELQMIDSLKIDSYELSDIKVIQPAENIGIIAYMLDASGRWSGQDITGKYYSSSTWIKSEDGRWKALVHTETKAAPMGGEQLGTEEE